MVQLPTTLLAALVSSFFLLGPHNAASSSSSSSLPRSPPRSPHTMEYLLGLIQTPGGKREEVPSEYDCAWRKLAPTYALKAQPWLTVAQQKALHDALQLTTLCGQRFVPAAAAAVQQQQRTAADATAAQRPQLFVDPVKGADTNPGTLARPLRTLQSAVQASRSRSHSVADAPVIQLRGGTYFLNATVVLNPTDSGLTIAAFPGEQPVISGGVHLTDLAWSQSPKHAKAYVARVTADLGGGAATAFAAAAGALPRGGDVHVANLTLGGAKEWCLAHATCQGFTMKKAQPTGAAAVSKVYFKGKAFPPQPLSDPDWVSYAKLPAADKDVSMTALQFPTPGAAGVVFSRAILSRYPNANPELDLFPKGYITDKKAQSWSPPTFDGQVCNPKYQCGKSVNLSFPAPREEWHGMYQDYTVGIGGSCEVYDPPWSPWCSGQFYLERQFPEMHTRHPSGLRTAALPNAPYKNPRGAVVHAWRPGHWYSWMFEVDSFNASSQRSLPADSGGSVGGSGEYIFGRGGNQGGEGSESAGEWWIEGMEEDLDAPGEFWFDAAAKELHYYPNATGPPPAEAVVPSLANLIELQGAQEYPVRNLSLVGLTFTANRPTFLDPRGNPSGGDWSLERMGAVMLEGVEDTLISRCTFTKLDSNALFLSGYARRVVIENNTFSWLGQNAIASWGRPEYNNGLNGDQPRGTTVVGNWATELGIIQKQSSFYFQAETAQAKILKNICFNIPRAAVNFNDGFGGGAEMAHNLLFNTCRESSDHGAFNSWDRLPYVTDIRDGKTPSTIPAWNNMHHNFIVANYAADGGCLDNDDGSSYYHIHHNYCVYGGHKSDFDGNSKISSYNLAVFPSVYGSKCFGELQFVPPHGFAEGYNNNICILPQAAPGKLPDYGTFGIPGQRHCDGSAGTLESLGGSFFLGNNTVYAPGGNASLICSGQTVLLQDFIDMGYDNGTTIKNELPSADTVTNWAKALLCPQGWDGSCW